MVLVINFPACKWLTYYVIEEFVLKCTSEKEVKLLSFIYKKWIKKLTENLIDEKPLNSLYNYNIYIKYKYRALSNKSYSSDWEERENSNTDIIKYYQKSYIKHLRDRLFGKISLIAESEKIRRVKRRWYCDLMHGIFRVRSQEFLFKKAKARFDF